MSSKRFRLFFWKGYLHEITTNCGKSDILRYRPSQRARYVLIRGRGLRGANRSQFSFTMRYYTFVSCWLSFCFLWALSVTFFFYSTLFCEPSISAGNQCAKLTAAAFNSVYFSVRTRFDRGKTTHKFISCKYVQKETDLIYFVSLLEVYEEMFRNVLLSNIC